MSANIQYLDEPPIVSSKPNIQYLDDGPPPSSSSMSLGGLGTNAVADIGRNLAGLKQPFYDLPKALLLSPAQMAQGTPFTQTDIGKFNQQGVKGITEGIKSFVQDPMGAMYRNPVTTVATVAGLRSFDPLAEGRIGAPDIPPERAAAVQSAQEAGVPLTRAEMTGSMPLSRIESFLQKTPLGSKPIQAFRNAQGQAISDLTQGSVSKFGSQESPVASGMEAREALQGELGANRKLSGQLYSNIPDVNIPLPSLTSTAQDIIQEQGKLPSTSQNPQIIKMASDYLNMGSPGYAGSPPSFQIMNKIRSDLGNIIREGQGTDRMYASRMQHALDTDLENLSTSSDVGNTFGDTYGRARGFFKNMMGIENNPLVKKMQTAPFQDMADVVFKSGDPQKVLGAQASLGDAGYEPLKRQFFSDLATSPNLPKQLQNYGPEFLNTAFSPGEVKALNSIASSKTVAQGAEKLSGNPSGTGQTILSGATISALLDAARRFPENPIGSALEAGSSTLGPYLASKAYLSPWMTKGIPYSVNPALAIPTLESTLNPNGRQSR